MKLTRLVLSFAVLASVSAARAEFEIPKDTDVLVQSGTPSALPGDQLRLLQWNIHKASAGATWLRDFNLLSAQADVTLVQEGYTAPIFRQAEQVVAGFQWFFATSFFLKGDRTGIVSATRWPTTNVKWYRSQDHEPVVMTPKMAMTMTLPLLDGRELLIVNIHSLNFTPNSYFDRQLIPVIAAIKKHDGPVVFGGDFNTWNRGRSKFLKGQIANAGLKEIPFANDTRDLKLDHLFVRGVSVLSAKLRTDVVSSDHAPILATISLLPPPPPVPSRKP